MHHSLDILACQHRNSFANHGVFILRQLLNHTGERQGHDIDYIWRGRKNVNQQYEHQYNLFYQLGRLNTGAVW
jgi:hypothetical protein